MMGKFQFHLPTEIHFGPDILQGLGEKARAVGQRALIAAGGMAKNSGALVKVIDPLEMAGIECVVFDQVEAQPRVQTMESGARICRETKCDMVIGIGGECPLDAAKCIAALAQDSLPFDDLFGMDKIRNKPLPIIAVPLTAGSGSEVTPYAAVKMEDDPLRMRTVVSELLYPNLAFVDPQFSLSFPSAVTIANGIDAFTHCIEGIISRRSHPLTDTLAGDSIRLITKYLPKALDEPKDLAHRSQLSYAALLGGIATGQTGMGLVHFMGYPLTLDLGMKHGEAHGLLLPWVCEYFLSHESHKTVVLAEALQVDIDGSTNKEAIEKVIGSIQLFLSRAGLGPAFEKARLSGEKLRRYAEISRDSDEFNSISPNEITTEAMEGIYRRALL